MKILFIAVWYKTTRPSEDNIQKVVLEELVKLRTVICDLSFFTSFSKC